MEGITIIFWGMATLLVAVIAAGWVLWIFLRNRMIYFPFLRVPKRTISLNEYGVGLVRLVNFSPNTVKRPILVFNQPTKWVTHGPMSLNGAIVEACVELDIDPDKPSVRSGLLYSGYLSNGVLISSNGILTGVTTVMIPDSYFLLDSPNFTVDDSDPRMTL